MTMIILSFCFHTLFFCTQETAKSEPSANQYT